MRHRRITTRPLGNPEMLPEIVQATISLNAVECVLVRQMFWEQSLHMVSWPDQIQKNRLGTENGQAGMFETKERMSQGFMWGAVTVGDDCLEVFQFPQFCFRHGLDAGGKTPWESRPIEIERRQDGIRSGPDA